MDDTIGYNPNNRDTAANIIVIMPNEAIINFPFLFNRYSVYQPMRRT